ncbi:MAG: radical SAM protein, partial [Coprobacillaceae bacterium]
MELLMKTNSLYIHIPFCETICSYCDFCKIYYQKDLVNNYLKMLHEELKALSITSALKTIYIGGGTPSSLSNQQLEYLLEMISSYIDSKTAEICIEVNPESMDTEKLKILKKGKVNRLSIGVQTFNEEILNVLERKHSNQQVFELIDEAQKIGFTNISIDLMYGLPNQTIEDI